jgi:hypothetical protein
LVVVVITLSTLLIMAAPPAATSASESGANPGAATANMNAGVEGVVPHQEMVSAHYGF